MDPGGPWRCGEGEEIELRPIVSNAQGTVTYAWDLDGDGVFDDGNEDSGTFSAVGVDGPSDGFTVGVVVGDDLGETLVDIPVDVTNTGPQFQNEPDPTAVIGRVWEWTPLITDLGGDTFEVSVPNEEDMPQGMQFDPLLLRFSFEATQGHLLQGEPLGHFSFRVTAQDEDNGRTNYDVNITIVDNEPPPTPPIAYPIGAPDEIVQTAQPTIILNNVDDPDGDEITYWLQVDSNPCFCSAEVQSSPAIPEGDFATEWRLPRPLAVEQCADEPVTYYVQRWTDDGISQSEQELSLFQVQVCGGGDGDADSDSDSDSDSDVDSDSDGDGDGGGGRGGCACATAPPPPPPPIPLFASLAIALTRRRK